ncbi:sulfur carrier protein ThiS [Mogibacterium timidum]|uniref:sulfur carrier protein ThiS n=1 Tax=Mogibacterium timidum TaxID=35519 RepID=UPI003AB9AD58
MKSLIRVNGREHEYIKDMTIEELIVALEYNPVRIAVEYMGRILPRSEYGRVVIADGDCIEIVCFMGGG